MKSRRYSSILWSAVLLAVTITGSNNATAFGQERATVPSPPADRRDRFGIYNWGVDYATYPAGSTVDRLNWAADKVAEIGSRTIRVAMPGDIYAIGGMNDDLAQAAASPAYDKLFSDPRFSTIMLTELPVKPIGRRDEGAVQAFETFLHSLPSSWWAAPDDAAREAARLRTKYKLRTPDVLLLGTAIRTESKAFVTSDIKFQKSPALPLQDRSAERLRGMLSARTSGSMSCS